MDDNQIKNKIKYYLSKHPLINSSDIIVFVYKGDVTLIGTVSNKTEIRLAEFLVKQMAEGKKVICKLELLSEAPTLRLPPIESIFQNMSRV